MGLPVGTIWQVGIDTVVNGQRCMNILGYRCTAESTEADIAEETLNLAAAMNAVGGIIPKLVACQSNDALITQVTAQAIRETRYARQVVDIGQAGGVAEDCTAQNLSAVIIKRTAFAGRWAVGSFHVPGLPVTAYVNGAIEPVYKASVVDLAAQLLVPVVIPIVGGTYEPVLIHPVGEHGGSTFLTSTEVQDELRVMRRRTVGLGI